MVTANVLNTFFAIISFHFISSYHSSYNLCLLVGVSYQVLASDNALYWSPSGTKLAFIQFNDTDVPTFSFPLYGDSRQAYTKRDIFRYPKAGYANPAIKLFIREVGAGTAATSANVELFPPDSHGLGDDYLIGNVKFRDDDSLLVIWTNRVQNESIVSLCDVASGGGAKCFFNIRDDSAQGWSWVMPRKELYLALDGSKYFLVRYWAFWFGLAKHGS